MVTSESKLNAEVSAHSVLYSVSLNRPRSTLAKPTGGQGISWITVNISILKGMLRN